MLHSQARQSSVCKHSPAARNHLRTRMEFWQRINSTNYRYFGKYELMAIMFNWCVHWEHTRWRYYLFPFFRDWCVHWRCGDIISFHILLSAIVCQTCLMKTYLKLLFNSIVKMSVMAWKLILTRKVWSHMMKVYYLRKEVLNILILFNVTFER
jgi:hypothetical protein